MTLKQAILVSLKNVAPHLMPEDALWVDTTALLPEMPTLAEVREALKQMQLAGWIVAARNEVTGQARYRLTDAGRLAGS
jgi:hypothetical protein